MFTFFGHTSIRLGMAITVACLVLMLFGAPYAFGALFFAASFEAYDALSSYSLRGKIVDGLACVALAALLVGGLTGHYFVGAQIVMAYAAFSIGADALASSSFRARYHAF
jgi:hypothetical protein